MICNLRGVVSQMLAATLFWAVSALAWGAEPPVEGASVRAEPTGLASDNERMVSYRHQEHLWQTSDGALHLVFNRGALEPWPGLVLFSSFDGGLNWVFQRSFADTDYLSSADGLLQGGELSLAYQTSGRNLVFTRLLYDPVQRAWALLLEETAYASPVLGAINPAIAVDALGTIWCGFVARDRVTNDVNLRLISRAAGSTGWDDPGLTFGPTDRRSIERSARPVRIPGGMGLVFTVRENTYWAWRADELPRDGAWAVETLFTRTPVPSTSDPYASHFNVVADAFGNVHLVTNENYDVLYFKRRAESGLWTAPKQVDDARKVVYMQVGMSNDKLAIAFSVQRGRGLVVVSPDLGETFAPWVETVLTKAVPGANFNTARVEMPAYSAGGLALLQQYAIYATQSLMSWRIPAP